MGEYVSLRILSVYGGAGIEPQINAMRQGVDIVVGTPGRVIDHLHRGTLDLAEIKYMVLDEADRMLDMGFIDDIKYVLSKLPKNHQTLLYV